MCIYLYSISTRTHKLVNSHQQVLLIKGVIYVYIGNKIDRYTGKCLVLSLR